MIFEQLAQEMLDNWQMLGKMSILFGNTDANDVVLMCIEHKPNILPSEISRLVGVSPPRVAVVIKELENSGLIIRQVNSLDKRSFVIDITHQGIQHLQIRKKKFVDGMSNLLQELGEEDATRYVQIMKKIIRIKHKQYCLKYDNSN
jgi:DNA-binding MarR family transcriptional regulator